METSLRDGLQKLQRRLTESKLFAFAGVMARTRFPMCTPVQWATTCPSKFCRIFSSSKSLIHNLTLERSGEVLPKRPRM